MKRCVVAIVYTLHLLLMKIFGPITDLSGHSTYCIYGLDITNVRITDFLLNYSKHLFDHTPC